jgi:Flp pilus assembly protein TadG
MGRGRARVVRDDQAGAAAVEFALVSLILVTLLVGIIQFAIWFWGYQAGSHAAREAARYAAVEPCDLEAIRSRGAERVEEAAPATGPTAVTVTRSPSSGFRVGDEITVEVSFPILDIGLIPGFPDAVTKSATSRIENIPAEGCSS